MNEQVSSRRKSAETDGATSASAVRADGSSAAPALTLPGATGYAPVVGAEFPATQLGAGMPDTIWTYDENGNRLHGRPNFDKPGVAERVEREAFYGEMASCATRGVSVLTNMRRANRFEEEQQRCTHCGASRDEAAMRCTVPGAQIFPCDGEAP